MTIDRVASWGLLAAAVVAVALMLAGVAKAAIAARRLVRRAQALELPAIDVDRASATIERVQEDLAAMTVLLNRAQAALAEIDANIRELADSPPVSLLRALLHGRSRASQETPGS